MSEKEVLKEGSEADQSADQQADCGKIDSNTQQADCGENKICRCESCDVCYYQWRTSCATTWFVMCTIPASIPRW